MVEADLLYHLLPHRYPFLLVDRVIELEPGKEIVALKRVSAGDEWAGQASASASPSSFPLSLIAEAMAQAASLVATSTLEQEERPPLGYYAAIKELKILREPRVGEEIRLRMKLIRRYGYLFEFQGEAVIGEERIGDGQLILGIGPS